MNRMGRDMPKEEMEWAEKIKRRKSNLQLSWKEDEHPGCEISGHLLVDRVPVRSTILVSCSFPSWSVVRTLGLTLWSFFSFVCAVDRETFTFKLDRLITIWYHT